MTTRDMDPTLGQTQPMASSSSSSLHPEPLLLPSVSPTLPSSSSSSTSSPSPSSRTLASPSTSPAPARPAKRRRLNYGDILVKRLEQLDERWQETEEEEDGRRMLPPDCVCFGLEMEEEDGRRVLPPDCVSFGQEMEEKRRVLPHDCVAFGLLVESMVARMREEERDSAFAEVVALLSEILAQHERREGQLQDTQPNSAAD